MTRSAEAYYAELARDYDRLIRQLVPRYDDMLGAVVDALERPGLGTVLELGTGTGALAARVLEALPTTTVTALDLSEAMLERARRRLARFGPRARVARRDLAAPAELDEGPWDAAFTNLVLHNLHPDGKIALLTALRRRVRSGGALVWGDMISFDDDALLRRAVDFRRAYAVEAGCPLDLVRWNFEKERAQDHPLTVEETMALGRAAGFSRPDVTWAHDQFAVVSFRT